jgi:hypothetical protein
MSRHDLISFDPAHEVVLGWDPPMGTFFAQVLDNLADEEDGTYEVLWIGTRFQEVLNPATVIAAVAPFATVPAGLLDQLARDCRADE